MTPPQDQESPTTSSLSSKSLSKPPLISIPTSGEVDLRVTKSPRARAGGDDSPVGASLLVHTAGGDSRLSTTTTLLPSTRRSNSTFQHQLNTPIASQSTADTNMSAGASSDASSSAASPHQSHNNNSPPNATTMAPQSQQHEHTYITDFASVLNRNDLLQDAMVMYKKVQDGLMDIDLKKDRYLATCVLFLASREKKDDPMSIRTLLSHDETRIILAELYDLLSASISVLGLEHTQLSKNMQLAQRKLIICDCLFDKYSEIFNKCFKEQNGKELFSFGWLLFLILNIESNLDILDFEEQYCRLEALTNYMWQQCPDSLKEEIPPNLAHDSALIEIPERIKELPQKIFSKLSQNDTFIPHHIPQGESSPTEAAESTTPEGSIFASLSENFQRANAYYDEYIEKKMGPCDFDARIFVTNRKLIGPSERLNCPTVVQMNLQDFSSQNDTVQNSQNANFMFSPVKQKASADATTTASTSVVSNSNGRPISPLDATLHSIQVLSENLKEESSTEPGASLKQYFCAGDHDLSEAILKKLDQQMPCVHLGSSISPEAKQHRLSMIRKLFFKTLRSTLQEEEKRQQTKNFTTLLQNNRFMTSLLACSVEAIMFGYNMKHCMQFEDVIKSFDLKPFDFVKIIESFVLNTSSWLSSPFKRHFRRVEETCIDSLGWDPAGPLFSQENYSPAEEATEMPKVNAPATPARKKRARAFQAFTSNSNGEKKVSPSLDFFFRKVHKLLAMRIRELCTLFDEAHDEEIRNVWKIVLYVLNNKRRMMIGRHLDHLIICSSYVVLNKLAKVNVTLKDILVNYRFVCEEQRHMSTVEILQNLNQIPLTDDQVGDIVRFYNTVFIPSVKDYVLQFLAAAKNQHSSNDAATIDEDLPQMPDITSPQRRRISKNTNVFVSPLRKSPRPKNKPLYSFGHFNTRKHGGKKNTLSPPPERHLGGPSTSLGDDGKGQITESTTVILPPSDQQRPPKLKRKLFVGSTRDNNTRPLKRQAVGSYNDSEPSSASSIPSEDSFSQTSTQSS